VATAVLDSSKASRKHSITSAANEQSMQQLHGICAAAGKSSESTTAATAAAPTFAATA
jgi:hypothetical protein